MAEVNRPHIPPEIEAIKSLFQNMIDEMKKDSSSNRSETQRPERVGVSKVQIVDEKGNSVFIDLIKSLLATTEKQYSISEKERNEDKLLKAKKRITSLDRQIEDTEREIGKSDQISKKEEEDLKRKQTSKKYEKEKYTIGERIMESRSKGKGLLSSILSGVTGNITDSVKSYVRESSLGKGLQAVGAIKGEYGEKTLEKIKSDNELRGDRSESLADKRRQHSRRIEDLKYLKEERKIAIRSSPNQSVKPTFTQEEQEYHEKSQTGSLGQLLNSSERTFDFFSHLSDPKSPYALNIRLVDSKIKIGGEGVAAKKEGGGLFDWITSGFSSIFTGLTGMLSGVGAALGGGVITGAVGLVGAASALGVSLYALKTSYDTTKEINDLQTKDMKLNAATNKKLMDWKMKRAESLGVSETTMIDNSTKDEGGNLLSRKILETKDLHAKLAKGDKNSEIGIIEDSMRERVEGGILGQLGDRMMGGESYDSMSKRLEELKSQRDEILEKRKIFQDAISEQDKLGSVTPGKELLGGVSVSAPTKEIIRETVSSLANIDSDKQNDLLVTEIRMLRSSLEKAFITAAREAETSRSIAATSTLDILSYKGPAVQPSTFYASPPTGSKDTQSVMRS